MLSAVTLGSREGRRAERESARRGSRTITIWIIAAAVLVLIAVGVLYQSLGGRWFIVETPSMGQTAPVGTLVLDSPASFSSLRVGQIISFHPPTDPSETYTHRIVKIAGGAISTRGDINGATDPWVLHSRDIIGRAMAVMPGIGWLVKALPYLLIGGVVVWAVTTPLRSPTNRAAWRIAGLALVAAITVYILKPFVGIILLATHVGKHVATATVVSTGLLPIQVTATHGTSARLVSGEVVGITIPSLATSGHYALAAGLDLSWFGWIIFGLACLTPLIWVLTVGLPSDPYRELRR